LCPVLIALPKHSPPLTTVASADVLGYIQSLVGGARDGIILASVPGRIDCSTAIVTAILGHEPEELLRQPIVLIIDVDRREETHE
jgi:uncharacterized membrane protein (DUF4010 family)